MTEVFSPEGRFYKGNLHAHTTLSDGRVSPEACIELFKQHGYDFLSITDHRKWFPGYEDEEILVVPGTEFDRNMLKGRPEYAYHITGVGLPRPLTQTNETSPQEIVDMIKAEGALCTLAHPSWSMMTFEMCAELKHYDAIEIYNTVSDVYSGRGYSDLYVDMLASAGIYKLITAVDDCHFYDLDPERGFVNRDACVGYIMVQAEERTWPALYRAIMAGRFFASQGPSITRLAYDREGVLVETSDAAVIRFMSNELYDRFRSTYPEKGEPAVRRAYYRWGSYDRYVRIEVSDAVGRKAWSNLILRPDHP